MENKTESRMPQFFSKSLRERAEIISQFGKLSETESKIFNPQSGLSSSDADQMIENALGVFGMPIGVAVNFVVDDEHVIVPMVVEEPSVIAAASHIAKLVSQSGGFKTKVDCSYMVGQIQVVDVPDIEKAITHVNHAKIEIIKKANGCLSRLVERGGGCVDVQTRILPPRASGDNSGPGPFLVVELLIDCQDAMGANLVNTAVEFVSDDIATLTSGTVVFRILSNLCDRRLARASCEIPFRSLSKENCEIEGKKIARAIYLGYEFAMRDPYRAATHNKGIMNGIDSLAIATGNDFRAIEAGAHAYAARNGSYESLSHFQFDESRAILACCIELPLAVGVVGGASLLHPVVRANLKMLGCFGASSKMLAGLMASVGLAQNIGAMRALAAEGIQKGHMELHLRKRDSDAHRV